MVRVDREVVVSVKKNLVRIFLLLGCFTLLNLAVPSAMAHHGAGHHPGGHCLNNPHDHNFNTETQGMSKSQKKAYKRVHRHHQHQCKDPYPPRGTNAPTRAPSTSGSSATLPAEQGGAFTVGMALAIMIGATLVFLVVRRRWVFSGRS